MYVHLDPEVGWEPLILALLLWPLACLAYVAYEYYYYYYYYYYKRRVLTLVRRSGKIGNLGQGEKC